MDKYSGIIGRKQLISSFKEAILTNKLSSTYIFSGDVGIGKKTLAREFSKILQCEEVNKKIEDKTINENNLIACDKCASCIKANKKSNTDIIVISNVENKKSISIDEIRKTFIEDAQIKPYENKYKIYIIDNAHLLTKQAQNAMLKTIEEPPKYAIIFLLATSSTLLLETIRSRSITYEIQPLSDDVVKEYLKENTDKNEDEIDFSVSLADGKIGKALLILNDENISSTKEAVLKLLLNMDSMSVKDIVLHLRNVKQTNEIDIYLDIMLMWFRDILIFASTYDANSITFNKYVTTIGKQAKILSYTSIEEITKSIHTARERLAANVNFDLTMQLLFTKIKEQF